LKFLTAILSAYMLLLALLPCGDEVECMDDERYETAFTNNNQQDHDNHSEICSPFCICACCGQALHVLTMPFFAVKPHDEVSERIIQYKEPYFEIIPQAIWQPPKLV
jgi:hypothetical protein